MCKGEAVHGFMWVLKGTVMKGGGIRGGGGGRGKRVVGRGREG